MDGIENSEPEQRRRKDGKNFRQVGSKQELYGFSDIVVYPASLFDCGDDCCEIVVRQYHIGNVFRHIRARYSHAHADVGVLYGGCVVDAVTCHCRNFSERAPRFDYAHFMLGLNAGIYRIILDSFRKIFVGNIIEFRSRYRLRCVGDYSEFLCYRHGGIFVVARYHNGAYARFPTFGYRRLDFGAYRVYHARKTYVAEVVFKLRRLCVRGLFFMFFFCGTEYAQRFVRHSFVFRKNLFANLFRHRKFFAVFKIMRAMF